MRRAAAHMKVGLVASTCWPVIGGMENYLRQLARSLVQQEQEVVVATRFVQAKPEHMRGLLTEVEPPQTQELDGARVQVLSPGRVRRQLLRPTYRLHFYRATQPMAARLFRGALQAELARVLQGCDVVHYSGVGHELLGFSALHAARRRGVPFVVTPHMHIGVWGDSPFDFTLYRQADALLALTQEEHRFVVAQGVAPQRVPVIGHGINVAGGGNGAAFRRRHGLDGPVVLFVGRKTVSKGYPLLLEAMAHVWAQRPEVRLVGVGPRALASETLSAAARAALDDARVHDLGAVSEAEKEDAYAACDLLCVPSEAEAYGMVYQEAWYYRKPVVARRIPTLQELIGTTGGGLLVDRTPIAVAEAILHLAGDAALRTRMGAAGYERARTQTWTRAGAQVLRVYRRAASPESTSLVAAPRVGEPATS